MFGVLNDVKKRICIGSRIIKVCRGCSTRVYIWWHAYSTHLACKLWITAVKIVIFYEYIYKIIFFFSGQKSQKKIGTLLKKQAQFSPWKSGPFLIIYCEIPWNTVDRFLSITVKYCEILYGILVNSYHLLCMHSGGKWSFTVIHKNSQVSTPKK